MTDKVLISRKLAEMMLNEQMSDDMRQEFHDALSEPVQQQEHLTLIGEGNIKPVAYMLSDAVGGSALEFQQHELYDIQRRYGGHIEPLYLHPAPADALDAARYRFVRKLENDCWMLNTLQHVSDIELDAAIDAALAAARVKP
jgi:hypothetical protein